MVNGIQAKWIHITLQKDIIPRNLALIAPIDKNEIVILGGSDYKKSFGEVLLLNI